MAARNAMSDQQDQPIAADALAAMERRAEAAPIRQPSCYRIQTDDGFGYICRKVGFLRFRRRDRAESRAGRIAAAGGQ